MGLPNAIQFSNITHTIINEHDISIPSNSSTLLKGAVTEALVISSNSNTTLTFRDDLTINKQVIMDGRTILLDRPVTLSGTALNQALSGSKLAILVRTVIKGNAMPIPPLLIIDFCYKEKISESMEQFVNKLLPFRTNKLVSDSFPLINHNNKSWTYLVKANEDAEESHSQTRDAQLFHEKNSIKSMVRAAKSIAKDTITGMPINVYIEAHGNIFGKAHHITLPAPNGYGVSTSLNLMKTAELFSILKKFLPDHPLNIIFISCYGGQAQAHLDKLPAGSTLLTLSNNFTIERGTPVLSAFKNYPLNKDFDPSLFAKLVLAYSEEQNSIAGISFDYSSRYPEKLLIGKVEEGIKHYLFNSATFDTHSATYKVIKRQLHKELGKAGLKALASVEKQEYQAKNVYSKHVQDSCIEGAQSLVAFYWGQSVDFEPTIEFYARDSVSQKISLTDLEIQHIISIDPANYGNISSILAMLNRDKLAAKFGASASALKSKKLSSEKDGACTTRPVEAFIEFTIKPNNDKFVNFVFELLSPSRDKVEDCIYHSLKISDAEFHELHTTASVNFYEFIVNKIADLYSEELINIIKEIAIGVRKSPTPPSLVESAIKAMHTYSLAGAQDASRNFIQEVLAEDSVSRKVFKVFDHLLQNKIKPAYDLAQRELVKEAPNDSILSGGGLQLFSQVCKDPLKFFSSLGQQKALSIKELLLSLSKGYDSVTCSEVNLEAEPIHIVQHELNPSSEEYTSTIINLEHEAI